MAVVISPSGTEYYSLVFFFFKPVVSVTDTSNDDPHAGRPYWVRYLVFILMNYTPFSLESVNIHQVWICFCTFGPKMQIPPPLLTPSPPSPPFGCLEILVRLL